MGIRIDPTLEFVWRDPATVQLGVDPPRAVVAVPTTGEERFLDGLRRETGHDVLAGLAAASGCSPERAAGVLGAASPAVVEVLPEPLERIEVHGDGVLADIVATFLSGEGVTVSRTTAPAGGPIALPEPEPRLAVVVADHVVEFAADFVRATRPHQPEAPEFVKELVSWGAGPRAGMSLITAAKARAVLQGRPYAITADVKWAALPVMRHRIATTFNAEAAGITTDEIITRLLNTVKSHEELDV